MPGRAVILPTPASFVHLAYWNKYYERFIEPSINTLYVHLNGEYSQAEIDLIFELFDKKNVVFKHTKKQVEHGDAIDMMLDLVTEEHVMLIEDDCFVFRDGFIDKMFSLLENDQYLLIGSKRGSCGQEILDASKKKYRLDYSGLGDSGCNFWPSYFFCSTDTIRETDRNFKAREFRAGFYSKELDHTFKETQYGDTFVNTSIQLMATTPQQAIHYIPQNHASPDDLIWHNKNMRLFNGNAKYIHVGSLSSFNYKRYKSHPEIIGDFNKKEWERRTSFYLTFWEDYSIEGLTEEQKMLYDLYHEKLLKMIDDMGLSATRIKKFQIIYSRLGL